MTSVEAGQYLAVPFRYDERRAAVNERLIAGCLELPNLFPIPLDELSRKIAVAAWLTDANHLFFEVWHNRTIVGILGLTRVVPGLDALAHFAFFDRQLLGRRKLVLSMMGWAFRELRLRRLSVEIPEHLEPLVRFARAKLGFRYEGEVRCADHREVQALAARRIHGPARWVARWGARRESSHFDGSTWRDLTCLRLLREEFEAMTNGAK